ncbi:MAG: DUF6268 family outer membrane beta-barrel protein [Bacteroidota bacterium]
MNQTWLKSFVLLVFIQMNGQVNEFQNKIQFQYGVAPSLGKHQMETYEYGMGKTFQALGMPSSFRVDYLNSRFTYFEVSSITDVAVYERLHLVDFQIETTKDFSNGWNVLFHLNPQLSSNFSTGLGAEDVILGFGLGISKKWNKSALTLGLERSTTLGRPQLLPFMRYYQKINESVNLQLGFPHSCIEYLVDQRHKIAVHSMAEGNYYNITGSSYFTELGDISDSKLNFSSFNFSLEHQYKIQPNITTITQIGLLANNRLVVEKSNGDSLFTFNTNESIYFSMGLQFNLNKNENDQ